MPFEESCRVPDDDSVVVLKSVIVLAGGPESVYSDTSLLFAA